jgi:serine/threonine-protein kinase
MLDRDLIAAALPTYDIGREVGRGGWGVVLSGRHRQLARDVAIKQLPRAFASDPEVRSRFFAEARLLASLDHPHIVPVYDFVETNGLCLLVMEMLPGGSVWQRFTERGVTLEDACAIGIATCVALDHAHGKGILHRDIKPENLMFSGTRALKVTDFGVARMLTGSRTMATRVGEVLGTPAYMAPEQAIGAELTPATDVYAVGVMLYELVSGQLPFPETGDPLQMLFRHVHESPRPLTSVAPHVPEPIALAIAEALEKSPADRPTGALLLARTLRSAARASLGAGWLERSSVTVMAAGIVSDVDDQPHATNVTRNASESVRPKGTAHATVAVVRDDAISLVPVGWIRHQQPAPGVSEDALAVVALLKMDPHIPPADIDSLEGFVLSEGQPIRTRLALSDHEPDEAVRSAVIAAVERWRRRAAHPLSDPSIVEAAEKATRMYEQALGSISDWPTGN